MLFLIRKKIDVNISPICQYLVKKLVVFCVTLWFAVTINFVIPRLYRVNPIEQQLRALEMTYGYQAIEGIDIKKVVAETRARLGLDQDMFTQYVSYLIQMFKFDFGISYGAFPTPVVELISYYLPYSLGLLFTTLIISWSLGVLLGVFIAFKRGSKIDSTLTSAMLFLNRIPFYILALILIYLLGYVFSIFPMSGTYGYHVVPGFNLTFISSLIYHSTLPALSILLVSLGGWMIMMRSTVVNILEEDYLTMAKAKGLRKTTIIKRYIFRNALLPQVTGLAMSLGHILGGSLIVETVFAYRGLGTLLAWAVGSGDTFVMQATFFMSTFAVLTANLIVDLTYALIDPRIRG